MVIPSTYRQQQKIRDFFWRGGSSLERLDALCLPYSAGDDPYAECMVRYPSSSHENKAGDKTKQTQKRQRGSDELAAVDIN